MRGYRGHGTEDQLDLTTEQFGHRRAGSLIGHVHHLRAGELVKQLGRHVCDAAHAARGVIQRARFCFGVGDQFANVGNW